MHGLNESSIYFLSQDWNFGMKEILFQGFSILQRATKKIREERNSGNKMAGEEEEEEME